MRRQRDAAFTDEIITNIKQFQPDTDCEKPDEMTDSHAKRKTCNSLVTGQKMSVISEIPMHVETVVLLTRNT